MKINDEYKPRPTARFKEIEEFIDKLRADNPQLLELPVDTQIEITKAIWEDLQSQ